MSDYDVTLLIDLNTFSIPATSFAQARAWAELAYRQGQISRDQEITRLRRALTDALARRDTLAEVNERLLEELNKEVRNREMPEA